jgi:hypothetical protein
MPEDILTRLPVAPDLLAGAFVLLIVFVLLRRIAARRRLAASRARQTALAAQPEAEAPEAAPTEPTEALPSILYAMPVVSVTEERLFDALGQIAADHGAGHRLLLQLSLNTFLYGCAAGRARVQDPDAVRQLAELQVDFLVVDADWRPVLAIDLERDEFSASPAEERKRAALDRAGIARLTVEADGLSEALQAEIVRHLGEAPRDAPGVAAE